MALQKQVGVKGDPKGLPDYTLPVSILAQIIEALKVDIVSQSLPELKVDVSAQSLPTVNVNISNAVTLNVNISSVSSDLVFNVNIVGSATLNVSIVSQTVDINIKTSGGANIVIDKLTQSAYVEDRRTLANNGAAAVMTAGNYTTRRGKYFPRGARGFVSYVEVYCDNVDTVEHTFTVYFCVQPGMAPVFSVPLSVPAGAAAGWRSVSVGRFWNYDSLFIYVRVDNNVYGRIGFDSGTPPDYYSSSDEVTWVPAPFRFWFRVNLTGLTVGDVPVSGTLNVVEIPTESSSVASGNVEVGANASATVLSVDGPGEVQSLILYSEHPSYVRWYVRCDGVTQRFMPLSTDYSFVHDYWQAYYGDVGVGLVVMITKHDTANNRYCAQIVARLPFKRKLEVIAYNADAVGYHFASASAVTRRLS